MHKKKIGLGRYHFHSLPYTILVQNLLYAFYTHSLVQASKVVSLIAPVGTTFTVPGTWY